MSLQVLPTETTSLQRLHITPLRPELLSAYLGPTILPQAHNISYHTVQNFPEVGFGYIELPMAEANKLKKKLNGSILKGHKIRIEDAQPEKRKRLPEDGGDDADEGDKPKKKTRRSKKTRPGDKVLQGYELEEGRKVKRGWTETPTEKRQEKDAKKKDKAEKSDRAARKEKKKAKREASRYTNEPECLFRTTLPNGADALAKDLEKRSKKDKKKSNTEAVVHEFSNTKKHASFLKSAAPTTNEHATREYVEGKGWVDADGNLVEAETVSQKERRERKEQKRAAKAAKTAKTANTLPEASAITPLQDATLRKSRQDGNSGLPEEAQQATLHPASEASSTEPSSPEPSSEDSSSASESGAEDEGDAANDAQEVTKAVHPLEALYKRPVLSPLDTTPKTPKENAFSFFGGEDDSDIDMDETTAANTEPQTPFNEQDLEWRTTRSAAPTPDTAAIGKRFSFSVMDDIDEDEDDEDGNVAATSSNTMLNGLGISADASGGASANAHSGLPRNGEEKQESEFAKWFFENRGENNKKWRLRRREAMKMKRKRENRRLTRRIV